ncbi:hypothetical protein NG767_10795 [Aliarcobacter cryaerophilus]|uniref:beta strand repeat-containing protein n=1 Tax=Aliarcobacter cryaerophilus TaxID=28198 RepID=UPI003DA4961F
MTSDFNGFTGDGKMTNVEVLDLTNTSTLARKFNTLGATGIEEIKIDANSKNFDVTNLSATGVTVDVSNASAANTTITVGYAAASGSTPAAASGTADELTVKFNDAGAAAVAATTTTAAVAQKTVTVKSAGIENLNVVSNGTANFVDLSVGTSKTVTVTGAADLNVKAVDATVTSVDASAATGDMTLNLSGATVATVKTGAGDDVVTLNNMEVNAALHGGAGTNKLVIDSTAAAAMTIQPEMTGFQTLQVQNLGGDLMVAGTSIMDLDTLLINDTLGKNVTIADLSVSSFTVDLVEQDGDTAAGTENITLTAAADLTVNTSTENDAMKGTFAKVINAANATSLALNVGADTKFGGTVTANKATSLVFTAGAKATVTGKVDAVKATSATITTASDTKTTFNLDEATSVSLKATDAQTALDIRAKKATTLEIDSAKAIVFAGTSDFSAVETVSFSGVGGLDMSAVTGLGAKAQSVLVEASNAKTAHTALGKDALTVKIDDYANADATNTGSATVVGSSLLANNITIGEDRAEVSVTGGIADDKVVYNTEFSSTTEGNVSINLGTISKNDTLTLANFNNDFSAATVTLTGVDKIEAANSSNSLTMNASVVSGQTIAIGSGTAFAAVNLNGSSAADTIDVSGLTVAGTGFVVDGGAGADTIILNSAQAKTTINIDVTSATGAYSSQSTTTAYDKITGFDGAGTKALIKISDTDGTVETFARKTDAYTAASTDTGVKGVAVVATKGIATFTIGNADGDGTDAYSVASLTEAISLLDAAITKVGEAVVFEYGSNSYLFAQNGDADVLVELTGVTGILDGANVIA